MIVLGIDPGVTGALALVDGNGSPSVWDVPTYSTTRSARRGDRIVKVNRTHYDEQAMRDLLREIWQSHCLPGASPIQVWLESVASRPNDGKVQAFSLGYGLGLWTGLSRGLGYEVRLVSPSVWKRHFGLLKKDKEFSRLMARERCPGLSEELGRKKDHGRAEALLIALYGLYVGRETEREDE